MIESAPAETPVICQVKVFAPAKSVPTLIVGVATEKRPFAVFSVTETLDRLVYLAAFTWFSMLTCDSFGFTYVQGCWYRVCGVPFHYV